MKWLKRLLILTVIVAGLGFVAIGVISVDALDSDLPTNVYEEDSDLGTVLNAKLLEVFASAATDDFTPIEEIINLVILDSIRDNVNVSYDPLGDCDTVECNFIIYEDFYYVNYLWAELNEDDQLVIYVSYGTEKLLGFNTIMEFNFDLEIGISITGLEISLTLESYNINDKGLSMSILDNIFARLDTTEIENSVSTGTLDLEEYSYIITFNPFS
ncbi:MAG: hypothetical protein QM489_03445 [Candidatus Izemoplasma sp.]